MAECQIWILGATGRIGRAVAAHLVKARFSPVMVGRDKVRLTELAADLGRDLRIVVADSVQATMEAISQGRPGVVINTIGPFTETALPIIRACPPGTHYVDLSNEIFSVVDLLGLHEKAIASHQTFVTGAGFGVLATECLVLKMCKGQSPAAQVRVDGIAAVESEPGPVGFPLAWAIVECLAAGGRKYVRGRLVRTRLFSDFETLALPDGRSVPTAAVPFGELEAAKRASGAPFVLCARNMVPPGRLLRVVVPAVSRVILRSKNLRDFAKRRIAGVSFKPKKADGAEPVQAHKNYSWARARVIWDSGESREGWLRTGDAHEFTVAVLVEVASRLARNEGRPGAYTPGALFGSELAIHAGGTFISK